VRLADEVILGPVFLVKANQPHQTNPPRGWLIPKISQNYSNNENARPAVHLCVLDIEAAGRYLAGLEALAGLDALAREARISSNPRVLICALKIIARQGKTVDELTSRGVE
jgi:hypothetical protein